MKADRGEKIKGLSMLWLIPAVVLAGFALVKAPMLLAKVLSGATMGAAKVAAESYKLSSVVTNHAETPVLFTAANSEAENTNAVPHSGSISAPARRQDLELKTNDVHLTGILTMNGKAVVFLSNGEVSTSDDRELQFLSRKMAIIANKRYVFPPSSSPPNAPPQSPRIVQPF